MRSKYLFLLASMCAINPRQVDGLRCADFFNLITGIDGELERQRKQNEQGG